MQGVALIGVPALFIVYGWLLWRVTRGADRTGAKLAARLSGAIAILLASCVGVAGLPAYGGGLYELGLIAWCLIVLLTPCVILASLATATVYWAKQRFSPHGNR